MIIKCCVCPQSGWKSHWLQQVLLIMVECYDLVWRQGIQIPLLPYLLSRPVLMSDQKTDSVLEWSVVPVAATPSGWLCRFPKTARKIYNLTENYGLVG